MKKIYTSLGLMSGTSMDGVDLSIINSDGKNLFELIYDKYFEYNNELYQELSSIRDKINNSRDLKYHEKIINSLEKKITLFHAEVINQVLVDKDINIDFIGFHGQTIFHNSQEKISKQLGDAKLLSSLTKSIVVNQFRQNDLLNKGQGAPLAPIFHKLIINKKKITMPVCILNIGGIANLTLVNSDKVSDLISYDIGPGNCLIDEWIRKKTKKKYDKDGAIALLGKTSEIILNQAIDNFENINKKKDQSFDIKDFDLNFVRGLSIEDGASTLTEFTGKIISFALLDLINFNEKEISKVLICGGGRNNTSLINIIKKSAKNLSIEKIDDYGINGDFIESQAFAYLAIRSFLKLPISFPNTTGCEKACSGGVVSKNY